MPPRQSSPTLSKKRTTVQQSRQDERGWKPALDRGNPHDIIPLFGGRLPSSAIHSPVVPSRVLRGNPLRDPSDRILPIYLPPGYEQDTRRYPVVYLLSGYTGNGMSFLNWTPWEDNLQSRMDRLLSEGACKPMILVMPNGFTRYGGSQYINSTATGPYQDYLLELVAWVDAHYRTIANRDHRAVAGHSSGGFGALTMVMDHPKMFAMIADHSGDKGFAKCYARDLLGIPDRLSRVDIAPLLADPSRVRPKDDDFFALMEMAAMSACYSPNPATALGFEWPVDTYTGELNPHVWSRWLSHDPLERLAEATEALGSLRLLFLDCGNKDEYSLHLGCRLMSRRMTQLGVPHHYEEFDAGHRDLKSRYDISLAAISAAMPQ